MPEPAPHVAFLRPPAKIARPAIFLDRDGTINVEKDYLYKPEDFDFLPDVPQALKRLQDAGFALVVVSNQSGVARGYYSLEDVDRLHRYMCDELAKFGVQLDGIFVCPHHPDIGLPGLRGACGCRKGRPGLLQQAAQELNLDLARSFMVGDKLSDVEAGIAAGCQAFLVETGHPLPAVSSTPRLADLNALASLLLD